MSTICYIRDQKNIDLIVFELLTRVTSLMQDSVSEMSMSSKRSFCWFLWPKEPAKEVIIVLVVSASLTGADCLTSGKNNHCFPLFLDGWMSFYIFSSINYSSFTVWFNSLSKLSNKKFISTSCCLLSSSFGLNRNVFSYIFLRFIILGSWIRSSLLYMVSSFWIRICYPS